MDGWAAAAESAARWWAAKRPGSDWREWVGVAWEGVARRDSSRLRRGLPPMTPRQTHLAARSAIVDEVRRGGGGFFARRNHAVPLLTPLSVLGDEIWVEPAARVAAPSLSAPPPRVKVRWTPAEERALRAALRTGARAADVAAGLGRTVPAVLAKSHALRAGPGRVGVPPDWERRGELVRLLGLGCTLSEAGRRMGVGANPARMMARRLVRAGLVVRTGGSTRTVRYVPREVAG